MTGLILEPKAPLFDNPTESARKKIGRFMGGIDWSAVRRQGKQSAPEIPGLDASALRRRYGPQNGRKPRSMTSTMKIPIGIGQGQLEREVRGKVNSWLQTMDRMGFDWVSSKGFTFTGGRYPAFDLLTQTPLLDMREYMVTGMFIKRDPEVIRLELPGHLAQPVRGKG